MPPEDNATLAVQENTPVQKATSSEHEAFVRAHVRHKRKVFLLRVGILVAFIGLWEIAAQLGWLDPFITSSPSRIFNTTVKLAQSGELFVHIGVTLLETVLGFVLGTLLGALIAVGLWLWPTAAQVLDPYLVVLNALPKIALGPIIIVWVGSGMTSIVVMALLISLVVTILGVLSGLLDTDPEKILLMRTFGATRMQILTKVVLPSSIPALVSALKINVGMSWVGVIVGEFLVSQFGLGYLAVYGGQVFQLDLVMTSVVILAILAALMYQGVAIFEKHVLNRMLG